MHRAGSPRHQVQQPGGCGDVGVMPEDSRVAHKDAWTLGSARGEPIASVLGERAHVATGVRPDSTAASRARAPSRTTPVTWNLCRSSSRSQLS